MGIDGGPDEWSFTSLQSCTLQRIDSALGCSRLLLKAAKTKRGTVTLFENIIYSKPQNPLKNCLFQKRLVSKNARVFISFCFVRCHQVTLSVDRMLISTPTQMTTQLLISIEHLSELNAQHVQRVSAPFIDFTVSFVIYLFQTKSRIQAYRVQKDQCPKRHW